MTESAERFRWLLADGTRPSLRQRMAEGYLTAAIFALESEMRAGQVARLHEDDDPPSEAYRQDCANEGFWLAEHERCEAIVMALESMA